METPPTTTVAEEIPPSAGVERRGSISNDDASLSEASDVAVAYLDDDEDMANTAPMHLNVLRTPRLRGRSSLIETSKNTSVRPPRSRSNPARGGCRSNNSSRSSSPLPQMSLKSPGGECRSVGHDSSSSTVPGLIPAAGNYSACGGTTATFGTTEGHSSASVYSTHSSLDGIFNPDILLDRLGFIDLDPPLPHEIRLGPLSHPDGGAAGTGAGSAGLTPVNERLSEETLDDCHAFQDLAFCAARLGARGSSIASGSASSVGSLPGRHSRGGSLAGSIVNADDLGLNLATLDEESDDDSNEERGAGDKDAGDSVGKNGEEVRFTN